jgi:ectoine hydroxylase-related dioxygenase (phytanoyl-CoA dioxygenase family)
MAPYRGTSVQYPSPERGSMKALLKDPKLQADFERHGFVVTRLFSGEQMSALLDLYHQHIRQTVTGLYESSRHNTYGVNRTINESIRDQIVIAGQDLFLPSKLYGGTFMVKSHIDSEVLPLHRDWNVVEPEKYRTFFVWCPLVDVSVVNGCLFVLSGSHRYFRSLGSGSYPSDRFILPPDLHKHTEDIPLKAGEAILYSDDLFHGSYANNGSSDRIVVTARVMEEEAELVYFQKASERDVDVYQADEEFYLTHIDQLAKGRLPAKSRRLYRRPYRHVPVTDETLQAKIRQHFPPPGSTPMKQLFRDARTQADFERDGYTVIDLIDQAQVDELKAFYYGLEHATVPAQGFQVSLDNASPDFVRTVSERLVAAVSGSVDKHFKDHKIFTASFVTKAKAPLGVVPPHQDWTFVDEGEFWSATIWCPLVDVSIDNGALGVIKGSHRLYDHVRPSPSPQFAPPFKDQLSVIFPYLTILDLKAGQAVVFDNRTIHASPPNTSAEVRVAFGIGVTHEEAKIRHYYLLPGREKPLIEGYEVEPGFFQTYNNARLSAMHSSGTKPKDLNSLGIFTLTPRNYGANQLKEAMVAAGNKEDTALVRKMAGLFGNPGGEEKSTAVGADQESPAVHAKRALPFWKVYTPRNIAREIRYRLSK